MPQRTSLHCLQDSFHVERVSLSVERFLKTILIYALRLTIFEVKHFKRIMQLILRFAQQNY